ncbi:hypothetical protein KIW84_065026 [Lathyrus oleraceus]|uniref:Uncharacterized protein n=1 Tax=Pisum sativum TaxID=3888 RepID=A0A9D5A6X1_PEA|nr:hypothetical protein KIW84_065026 [Pisum sativum]
MIHNRHNGSFHGQKSNLKQLGPKGIRAHGAKDDQPPNSTSSPNNNTYNHDGLPSNSVYFQEKKDVPTSKLGFNGFVFSDSRGFTGGIAMGWKPEKLQVHVLKCHFQFIHSQTTTEEGKVWHLSAIYDSPLEECKKELWTELADIATSMNTGWIRDSDNNWIEDEVIIKALFHDHFKNLFTIDIKANDWFQTVQQFSALGDGVSRALYYEVQDSKIKRALFNMKAWKSSGSYGFPVGFYQNTSHHIGDNIYSFIHQL